jgi:hypothetical protein
MRRLLFVVACVALGLATQLPAQVPPVGATRDVGVDCLCPGKPIAHYPADTSCLAICTSPAVPSPSTSTHPTTTRPSASTTSSSISSSMAVMNAVSGVMGILGSYFEERAAANAAAEAAAAEAQMATLAEQRRRAAIALERQRQLFEQEKQAVLSRMIGARATDLEFKGSTSGALQMKGIGEVARAEADAAQRPLREWMQSRLQRLGRDLEIDGRTGLFNFQAAGDDRTPAYAVETGGFATAPAPDGSSYSVDAGKAVAAPIGPSAGAYSVDTGRVVTPPAQNPNDAYSVETGRVVTPTAPDPNGATLTTGTGAGLTPAVTQFDGTYSATITFFGPPGVTPTFPVGTPFTFDVVNGAPQSNRVLGDLNTGGQLTNGRSQVTLRIGPSGTIVVPIGGTFSQSLNTPAGLVGTVPCATGTCSVIVTVTRQTAR